MHFVNMLTKPSPQIASSGTSTTEGGDAIESGTSTTEGGDVIESGTSTTEGGDVIESFRGYKAQTKKMSILE